MPSYMNQLKARRKIIYTERLLVHFKSLKLTKKQIEAQLLLLFPIPRPKLIKSEPLSKAETELLFNLGKLDTWKQIAEKSGWQRGSAVNKFARLAYRYLKNLK